MTNTQNQTNTLAKGVTFNTSNNEIANNIRNINIIKQLEEGTAEVFESMEADGVRIVLETEEGLNEFFFEPTAKYVGIDCLHYPKEPSDKELFFISLACECIYNRSGMDIGQKIQELNTVPTINSEDNLEKLLNVIQSIEELIEDGSFYPKGDFELMEDYQPLIFTKNNKSSINPTFFLNGYAVSDEIQTVVESDEKATTSKNTKDEIASAVIAPISEEPVLTEIESQPSLTIVKNEDVATSTEEISTEVSNEKEENVVQISLFNNEDSEKAFNILSLVMNDVNSISNTQDLDIALNSTDLDILSVGDLVELANNIGFSYTDIANVCKKHYSTIYKLQSRNYILEKGSTAKNKSLILVVNAIGELVFKKFNGFVIEYKGKNVNIINNIFNVRGEQPIFVASSTPQKVEQPQVVASVEPTPAQNVVATPVQPTFQQPVQQMVNPSVVSVVETKGPALPKADVLVEQNTIAKVSSIISTISMMEVKASKVNPNVSVLNETIDSFLELDSPNRELVQNLKAVTSTISVKKEHFTDLTFKFSLKTAEKFCDIWVNEFSKQNPTEGSELKVMLDEFRQQKSTDLLGHTYSLEELKALRPKFFDDTWVVSLLKKFDVPKIVINEILQERVERREFLIEHNMNDIILVEPEFKFIGKASKVRRAINNIHGCHHMLTTGDTGCGKTTLIESLSCLTNKPMYKISGNTSTNSESFLGFNTLSENEIEFVTGLAVRAMRTGGILYVDETNTIKANVLAILYPLLDHSQGIYNDLTGKFEKSRKGFVFVGSYNPNYADTNEISSALLGRTVGLKLGYMTSQELEAYLSNIDSSVDAITIKKLSAIFKILTSNLGGVDLPPAAKSTRHIITILNKIKDGRQTLAESLEDILDNLPEDDASLVFNALTPIKDILGIEITGTSIIQKSL